MAIVAIEPTYLLASAGLLITAKLVWELLFSPLKSIPGPFLAKFTDGFRSYLTTKGDVDVKHREWHDRWGTAVRIGPNAVSLSDPELIKVIYGTKNAWRKSNMYRVNDVVVNGQRIPNIFNTQDPEFHSRYTKPIGGLWTLGKVLEQESFMDETLHKLVNVLDSRFGKGGDAGNKVCMMDEWLTFFAWDAAANVSFAHDYGFIEQGQDVGGIIAESTAGLKYFAPVCQIPWLDNWLDKNPLWRIGPRPLVNGFLITVGILGEHQKQLSNGTYKSKGAPTWLERYQTVKQTHPDVADDAQVLNWLMLNVLAGGDSTAGAMRSAVYCLSKSPEARLKLVAELDAANLSMPAQWRDLVKLPYLEAVMRESQRRYPAVGLMFEREVPAEGFSLPDGRFLPAGTKVGINPSVVNMDRGVFGDDVEDFNPDRWMQRNGETSADFAVRERRMQEAAELMFGAGKRACMGKWMAKMLMYKVVATLYSTFDVEPVDPKFEWDYFNSWFMYQSNMPLTLTRRNQWECLF